MIEQIIKERLNDHSLFIEKGAEEVKKLSAEMQDKVNEILSEDNKSFSISVLEDYKALYMYSSLLYKDIESRINKFIECYEIAYTNGIKFNKKEQDLFDKYIESNSNSFVLVKGEIESKTESLLKIIKQKTKGSVTEDHVINFIKNIDIING